MITKYDHDKNYTDQHTVGTVFDIFSVKTGFYFFFKRFFSEVPLFFFSGCFFFSFSFNFTLPTSLIPASLYNGLNSKKHAYCNDRKEVYDSVHIKNSICKIVKMSAYVKYLKGFLDAACKKSAVHHINNCKSSLSDQADHCRNQEVFDHCINNDRSRQYQKSKGNTGRQRASEKKEEIPFIIKKANRNTKVNTAAITWLSVREEINTPMARFAHPRRKNPRIPVYAVPKDTVPNFDITRGYSK